MPRPKSPDEMMAAILRNLEAKTGRSPDEWQAIARAAPPGTATQRILWLKDTRGIGRGQAQAIVWALDRRDGYAPPSDEELIGPQYAGARAALRPILDGLIDAARALGDDVSVEARQTYVTFNRQRQFAIVKASTQTSVDLGLVLPGEASDKHLVPAGPLGSDRLTHKVTLRNLSDVDDEVRGWLKAAYEADAAS